MDATTVEFYEKNAAEISLEKCDSGDCVFRAGVSCPLFDSPNPEFNHMYEEYQIEIPQSFMALFVDPGRAKPNAPRHEIAARYELCEDLANMLTESAWNMIFSVGVNEREVLERCRLGLTGESAVVTEPEADWVVRRLTELLGW